jgi:hypothetical protein
LAECDDDELEINLDKKPKAKLEKGRRKKLVENYLHESEDDIIDFTAPTTCKNILSKN